MRKIILSVAAFSFALGLSALAQAPQKIRVGLGYIPDIQFAPFYLAETAGLYKAKGLEVEFQHGYAQELYPLLASGKLDFVVGDAEDVILLRAKDAKATPFKYIMAMYQKVPNAIFSKADKEIKSIKDLKGKTIGIPGKYGTSWTSMQAILKAAKLSESDVKITEIGFTQLEAVLAGRVDAAMGFINNEPVLAEAQGLKLNIIAASRYNRSPGNGVITLEKTLENRDMVKAFLGATQASMAQVISNPKQGLEAAKKFVQNLSDDRLKVLEASTPLYQSPFSKAEGLGYSNPNGWQETLDLLTATGRITTKVERSSLYSNVFLTPKVQAK
jgi:NitT/TauT family transport system substrate-binding protein